MKLPVIKQLATDHTLEQLQAAEAALMDGQPLPFAVDGTDEGEQLTHLLGAMDVLQRVAEGEEFNTALRAFAQRVRASIG